MEPCLAQCFQRWRRQTRSHWMRQDRWRPIESLFLSSQPLGGKQHVVWPPLFYPGLHLSEMCCKPVGNVIELVSYML